MDGNLHFRHRPHRVSPRLRFLKHASFDEQLLGRSRAELDQHQAGCAFPTQKNWFLPLLQNSFYSLSAELIDFLLRRLKPCLSVIVAYSSHLCFRH